jgi:putative membrane protein
VTADAWLAVAHHLAVFALLGVLATEWGILRRGLDADGARWVTRVDALYGLAALAVLVAGVARVVWGSKPAAYYLENPVFWVKMAAFGTVGALSVRPTLRYLRWRGDDAAPPDGDVAASRRAVAWQLAVFPVIPVAAALMARGIGL